MCLFPIDGYQQMLIPPTERARKLAMYTRGVIYFHLLVILGFFLSALYVDGVVDLLGAMIGFMSIRNNRGYNFQQPRKRKVDCEASILSHASRPEEGTNDKNRKKATTKND